MEETSFVTHPFEPVYDAHSRILILGSFPSVQSRKEQFYYAHPQNRFWKVLSGVLSAPLPCSVPEKKDFLLLHRIALWDVIASCNISGSADSSIKDVTVNDFSRLFRETEVQIVFANGQKAFDLARRYGKNFPVPVKKLPSTSPANAAYSLERLCDEWRVLTTFLNDDVNRQDRLMTE